MPSWTGGTHFFLLGGSLKNLCGDVGDTLVVAGGEIHKEEDVPIVDVAGDTEEAGGGQDEEGDEDAAILDDEAIAEGFVG